MTSDNSTDHTRIALPHHVTCDMGISRQLVTEALPETMRHEYVGAGIVRDNKR